MYILSLTFFILVFINLYTKVSCYIIFNTNLIKFKSKYFNKQLFCTTSSSNNDVASVVERCKLKISEALETNSVSITTDQTDPNGMHIEVDVESILFENKRKMKRHQMVYKALWEELADGGPIHAVDNIIARAPGEE